MGSRGARTGSIRSPSTEATALLASNFGLMPPELSGSKDRWAARVSTGSWTRLPAKVSVIGPARALFALAAAFLTVSSPLSA